MPNVKAADVVQFWREAGLQKWFSRDDAFDAAIRERFEHAHHAAARGEFDAWAETPEGALALLLLLDQFPRNLYRDSPHAFATDPLGLKVAKAAVARGFHQQVEPAFRPFFVTPFEHSERLEDQERGVEAARSLNGEDGGADTLGWAQKHHDVIARFGRFPHRNAALGRVTTPDEAAFLEADGFSG